MNSFCNSNCVPVNTVDQIFPLADSNDWYYANFQYTNWHCFSPEFSNHVYIVFVTTQINLKGKFYYLVGAQQFGPGQLFHCDSIPEGSLEILYSQIMLIHRLHMIETFTSTQKHYAKCIAEIFYQECKAFDEYHMPYEQFMDWFNTESH